MSGPHPATVTAAIDDAGDEVTMMRAVVDAARAHYHECPADVIIALDRLERVRRTP
jgi:hypothetical protein